MPKKLIPIAKPLLSTDEERAVLGVLRSGRLAQGPQVAAFEEEFARYLGCRYAVAVCNGTTALHLAMLSLHLAPGDEVITTPFSFVASTNAILYVGATPVFVDIGNDYNIDVSKIESAITKRTKAILPVHLYGYPCDMDPIVRLAQTYHLAVVEDACQAHGAVYKGKKAGTLGDVGCFSFYATKNMTTGEGGMMVTNNAETYAFLKKARSHGSEVRYYHDFIGFNYRMTEVTAAIGRVQLQKLDHFNALRIRNAQLLTRELSGIRGIELPVVEKGRVHVFHQYTIRVTKHFALSRKALMDVLDANGIGYSIFYPVPIHKQKAIRKAGYGGDFPVSEEYSREVLSLPVHPAVSEQDIHSIGKIFRDIS